MKKVELLPLIAASWLILAVSGSSAESTLEEDTGNFDYASFISRGREFCKRKAFTHEKTYRDDAIGNLAILESQLKGRLIELRQERLREVKAEDKARSEFGNFPLHKNSATYFREKLRKLGLICDEIREAGEIEEIHYAKLLKLVHLQEDLERDFEGFFEKSRARQEVFLQEKYKALTPLRMSYVKGLKKEAGRLAAVDPKAASFLSEEAVFSEASAERFDLLVLKPRSLAVKEKLLLGEWISVDKESTLTFAADKKLTGTAPEHEVEWERVRESVEFNNFADLYIHFFKYDIAQPDRLFCKLRGRKALNGRGEITIYEKWFHRKLPESLEADAFSEME